MLHLNIELCIIRHWRPEVQLFEVFVTDIRTFAVGLGNLGCLVDLEGWRLRVLGISQASARATAWTNCTKISRTNAFVLLRGSSW